MADPTLIRGSGNFRTTGSTTLTFYNTQQESIRKSANLIPVPLPATNSSGTLFFDLLGAVREIRLRGKYNVANGTVKDFTDDLNSLITGVQGNTGAGFDGYQYVPQSISGANVSGGTVHISCYVNDVAWDYVAGEPNSLDYSVVLSEKKS